MSQAARVLRYIREHPGCSTMELTLAMSPFISNPRARISDLRAKGYEIEAQEIGGFARYYLRERAVQIGLDGSETAL